MPPRSQRAPPTKSQEAVRVQAGSLLLEQYLARQRPSLYAPPTRVPTLGATLYGGIVRSSIPTFQEGLESSVELVADVPLAVQIQQTFARASAKTWRKAWRVRSTEGDF